ncbi:hypothetical protein MHYP_G00165000 [Metynnis hypsauchen]
MKHSLQTEGDSQVRRVTSMAAATSLMETRWKAVTCEYFIMGESRAAHTDGGSEGARGGPAGVREINSFAFLTPNKHDFISERSPYPPAPLSLGLSNPKALLNHRRVAWSGRRGSSSRAVLKLRAIPPPPSVSPEPEPSRGGAKAEERRRGGGKLLSPH